MKVLKVFFAGLLYGWFMKWIIDEIFVRDQYRMITNENAELRERIQFLEAIKPSQTVSPPLPVARAQPLQYAEPALEPVAPVPSAEPVRPASKPDDLKLIKGIGPQLEKKLNKAGITTFEQMSRLTTTDLQNILGLSKRGTQNADNLISQARKFARDNSRR